MMPAWRSIGIAALAPWLAACGRSTPPEAPIARDVPHAEAASDAFDPATLATVEGDLVARLHLIDVGQGAATLIELPCGAILIDSGGEASRDFSGRNAIGAYLETFFGRRPDLARTIALLVVTHPHVDHTRSLKAIVDDYEVENVVTDGRTSGSGGPQQKWLQTWARDEARYQVVESEKVPPGGLTSRTIDPLHCKEVDPEIRALWGSLAARPAEWSEEAFEDENNHSVVVRIEVAGTSFLVGGDLEMAGMNAVLAKHAGTRALDVDVLELNHHGSDNGTSKPWLDATSPKLALIAMGPREREGMWTAWAYGHPRRSVLDLLLASSVGARPAKLVPVATRAKTFESVRLARAVYGTGWDGDVVVTATRGGRYRVQTRR